MNGYEFYVFLFTVLLGIPKQDLLIRLILREIEDKTDR
ncbi:MAG: hypothetical protein ANABAC_1285 [Anaerolineae bacterium]|nr:MAG: hypothetical protein ANABAC_1285 [Anaerolineae bacterium]